MAKFLIEASYSAEGMKGLRKDKASGRKAAITQAFASFGGKVESIHYALGDADVYVIAECPDNVTAAAIGFAVCATGLVRTKTIPLLTVEEMDQALSKNVAYRAPGA